MKNPPDPIWFLELGIMSILTLAVGLFILSGMDEWTAGEDTIRFTIGAVVCIGFSVVMVSFTIIMQIVKRPKEVIVDNDGLKLHWRFKDTETFPMDSISDLIVDPRAPKSIMTRWTGGSIGFRGKKMRFGFTYEIVVAVRQHYFEKFGYYPPPRSGENK